MSYVDLRNNTVEPYPAFRKIPRLNREIVITEKIDGSNGLIRFGTDGNVTAGSRKRWLAPGKSSDNFGFAQWVADNAESLFRDLGPGDHYGEWFGRGIQSGYGLDYRAFALFNTTRWAESLFNTGQLMVVPELFRGLFNEVEVDQALRRLQVYGSVLVPGFMRPEGVVVFHTASGQLFKVTLENDDAPKGR